MPSPKVPKTSMPPPAATSLRPCDVRSREHFEKILARDEANIEEMKSSSDRLLRAAERTNEITRKSKEISRSMSRGRSLPRPAIERELIRQGKITNSPTHSEVSKGESPRTLVLEGGAPPGHDIYEHTLSLVNRVDKVDGIMNRSLTLVEDLKVSERAVDVGNIRASSVKARGNATPTATSSRAQAEAALVTRLAVPKRKCVTPTQGSKRAAQTLQSSPAMERSKSSGTQARLVSGSSRSDSPNPPSSASSACFSSASSTTFQAPATKAFQRTHTVPSKENSGHQKRAIRPPSSGPPKRTASGVRKEEPRPVTPKTARQGRLVVPNAIKSPKTTTAPPKKPRTPTFTRSQSIKEPAPVPIVTTPTNGSKTPKSLKNVTIVEPGPLEGVKLIPMGGRVTSESPILPPEEYGRSTLSMSHHDVVPDSSLPPSHCSAPQESPAPTLLASSIRDQTSLKTTLDSILFHSNKGGAALMHALRDLEQLMSGDGSADTGLEMCFTHYTSIMEALMAAYESTALNDDDRNRTAELVDFIHGMTVPEEMTRMVASLFLNETGFYHTASPVVKCALMKLLADIVDASTASGGAVAASIFERLVPILVAALTSSEVGLRKRAVFVFVSLYAHLRDNALPYFVGLGEAQLKLCQHYISKHDACAEADLVFEVAEYLAMR